MRSCFVTNCVINYVIIRAINIHVYHSPVQNNHYFTMIPANALVERAGGDPTNTKGHEPVWFSMINKLMPKLETLIEFSFPGLLPNVALQIKRFQMAANHKERTENRLYMNRGAAEGFVFQLMVMILQMASRPTNTDTGLLVTTEPPIYIIFRKSTMLFLAWHKMFDQPAFKDILDAVTDAQTQEYKLRTAFQLPPQQMDQLNKSLHPFFTHKCRSYAREKMFHYPAPRNHLQINGSRMVRQRVNVGN